MAPRPQSAAPAAGAPSAEIAKHVAKYAGSDDWEAARVLAITVAAYVASLLLFPHAEATGSWPLMIALGVVRAMILSRTMIVMHDMGHNSFFSVPAWNHFFGKILGVSVGERAMGWLEVWAGGSAACSG